MCSQLATVPLAAAPAGPPDRVLATMVPSQPIVSGAGGVGLTPAPTTAPAPPGATPPAAVTQAYLVPAAEPAAAGGGTAPAASGVAQFLPNGTAVPAAAAANAGSGAGAAAAISGYTGPATPPIVPNTIARTLPQLPPGVPRPLVITNPLYYLANGAFQRVIYGGGISRSPGLPTVPTPTPPVPAAIYQDPYTTAALASGTSPLTDPEVLSIFRSWPLNNQPPRATLGAAASAGALLCSTPLTAWCTQTTPTIPSIYRNEPPANVLGYYPPGRDQLGG